MQEPNKQQKLEFKQYIKHLDLQDKRKRAHESVYGKTCVCKNLYLNVSDQHVESVPPRRESADKTLRKACLSPNKKLSLYVCEEWALLRRVDR